MKCDDCLEDMLDDSVKTCTERTIEIHGTEFSRDAKYYDKNSRCHDCNIVNISGNIHHAGCDMERCPCCGGQLISCGCLDDDSDCEAFRERNLVN